MLKPNIIKGGHFKDERGSLKFFNDFKFDSVKRFYFINHCNIEYVRAWQGHQFESKYFYSIKGSFVVAWVQIDDFLNPSINLKANFHIVNHHTSELIFIPPGYANGLRALMPDSEIMIFSDMEVEQSVKEQIRFKPELWFDWNNIKPLNL